MNISDVKKMLTGASYEDELEVLESIYEYAGDDVMNGYLGSSVMTVSYDSFGKVEFDSRYKNGKYYTNSTGAVLENSLLIRQVQECEDKDFYQLISWKKDGSSYSYIVFNSEDNLEDAYIKLKRSYGDFLDGDINSVFDGLDISFDNIMNIKTEQKVEQKSISIDDIMEAYDESLVTECLDVSKSIA